MKGYLLHEAIDMLRDDPELTVMFSSDGKTDFNDDSYPEPGESMYSWDEDSETFCNWDYGEDGLFTYDDRYENMSIMQLLQLEEDLCSEPDFSIDHVCKPIWHVYKIADVRVTFDVKSGLKSTFDGSKKIVLIPKECCHECKK